MTASANAFKSSLVTFLAVSMMLGIRPAVAVMGDVEDLGLEEPDANSSFTLVTEPGTAAAREEPLSARQDPATGTITLTSTRGDAVVLTAGGGIRLDPDVVGQNWQLNRNGVPIVVSEGGVLRKPGPSLAQPAWLTDAVTFGLKIFGARQGTHGQDPTVLRTTAGETPSTTIDHVTGPGAELSVETPFDFSPFAAAILIFRYFDGDSDTTQTTPPGADTAYVFGANAGNGSDFTGILLGNNPVMSNSSLEVRDRELNFALYSRERWWIAKGQARWGLRGGIGWNKTQFNSFDTIPNNLVTLDTSARADQTALQIGPEAWVYWAGLGGLYPHQSYVKGRIFAQYTDTCFEFMQRFHCQGCLPRFASADINLQDSDSSFSIGGGVEAGLDIWLSEKVKAGLFVALDFSEVPSFSYPSSGDEVLANQTASVHSDLESTVSLGFSLRIPF